MLPAPSETLQSTGTGLGSRPTDSESQRSQRPVMSPDDCIVHSGAEEPVDRKRCGAWLTWAGVSVGLVLLLSLSLLFPSYEVGCNDLCPSYEIACNDIRIWKPIALSLFLRKHFPPPHISRKSLDKLSVYAAVMSKHMHSCQNYVFQAVKVISLYRYLGYTDGSGEKLYYWVRRKSFHLKDRRLGFETQPEL